VEAYDSCFPAFESNICCSIVQDSFMNTESINIIKQFGVVDYDIGTEVMSVANKTKML